MRMTQFGLGSTVSRGIVRLRGGAFGPLLALLSIVSTPAATHTWSGAVNGLFSNAGNWSGGGVPTLAETNTLSFPGSATRFTVTNDIGALKVYAIAFTGSNYIVRGASTITVVPNLININCQGSSNTIESPLNFSGYISIVAGTGDSLILAGAVTGANGFGKTSDGDLIMRSTANNFSGEVDVFAGRMIVEHSSGLGGVADGTIVSSGATLELRGAGMNSSEPLTLAGLGDDGLGALQTSTGNHILSGPITLTAETGIGVNVAANSLTLSGVVSGAGGIRKFGDGNLLLTGAANNTFTGASFVNKGTLTLDKSNDVRAIASVTVTNNAKLILASNNQIDNAAVVSVYSSGLFSMTNYNESIGGLNLGRPNVIDTGTGTLTLLGDVFTGPPYAGNTGSPVIRGQLSLGGGIRRFNSQNYGVHFDCVISDGAGVGGLSLYGGDGSFGFANFHFMRTNAFNGPVFADYAGMFAHTPYAFGTTNGGVYCTNDSGFVFFTTNMVITGETAYSAKSFGMYSTGDNAWNGPVVLLDTNSFLYLNTWIATLPNKMTINGHISGPGGVTVGDPIYEAPGFTAQLTQSNSFSGPATITTGTILLQHRQALGSTNGATIITADSTLQLDLPDGTVVNEPLTFDSLNLNSTNTPPRLLLANTVSNNWAGPITTIVESPLVEVTQIFGNLALSGGISGFGGLEKIGIGFLWLSGNTPNTYSGMTTVTDGYLMLNKPNGVPAIGNLTVNESAEARWQANYQLAPGSTVRLIGGSAYLPAHDETIAQLATDFGWISTDSGAQKGTLLLLGDIDATQDHGYMFGSSIHGRLCLSAGEHYVYHSFLAPPGNSSVNLTADICETNGMSTLNASRIGLSLSGSNTFTGPLNLYTALVVAESTNAFGSPAQGVNADRASSLILNLPYPGRSGVSGETLTTVDSGSGTFRFGHTNDFYDGFFVTNFWSGPIKLFAEMEVVGATNVTLDLRGPIDTMSGTGESLYGAMKGALWLTGTNNNTLTYLMLTDGQLHLAKAPGVRGVGLELYAYDYAGSVPEVHVDAPDQLVGTPFVRLDGAKLFLHDHPTRLNSFVANEDFVYVYCGTNPASSLTLSNSGGYPCSFYGEFNGTLVKQAPDIATFSGLFQNGDLIVEKGLFDSTLVGGPWHTVVSAGATVRSVPPNFFNFGALSGSGTVHIAGNYNWVGGGLSPVINSTFTGTIIGTNTGATLLKTGPSVFTLAGPISQVSTTYVYNGTLLVNTVMTNPVSIVSVGPGNFPTLGGTGVVGHVTTTGVGPRIAPGATASTPSYGKLTVASLNLGPGAALQAELSGTNIGVNMDQLESTGGVNLAGGSANFTAFGVGATSNRYAVVKSALPVVGTFLNDPEGDYLFPAAGRMMIITYLTAGGKEITLIEQPGGNLGNFSISTIARQTNGNITLTGDGNPGSTYFIEANTNLSTTNWITIGSSLGAWDGTVYFTDTNAPSMTQRFYRFRLQ